MPNGVEFAREAVLKELAYRRDKQWKIFAWTSGLLTALLGGVVALDSSAHDAFRLTPVHRVALTLAVVSLGSYAVQWLVHNWKKECEVHDSLAASSAGTMPAFPERNKDDPPVGYPWAIGLLAACNVIATWLPSLIAWGR